MRLPTASGPPPPSMHPCLRDTAWLTQVQGSAGGNLLTQPPLASTHSLQQLGSLTCRLKLPLLDSKGAGL